MTRRSFNFVSTYKDQIPDIPVYNTEFGRRYGTPEGLVFPSITTILGSNKSEGLKQWIERVGVEHAEQEKKRGGERGDILHEMCEHYLQGKLDLSEYSGKSQILFGQLRPYLNKVGNIYLQETALWSNEIGLAGRVDLIADYEGRMSVIDFKSSSKLKRPEYLDNYRFQVCFYANAFEERTGVHIDQAVILLSGEHDSSVAVETINPHDHLEGLIDVKIRYDRQNRRTGIYHLPTGKTV